MIDRLDEYLRDPDACLPSLNAVNGSHRRQRLERRTACVLLLGALVRYLDLVSLRVGIPQRNGDFMSLTLPFLAKKAGMGLRRAERAMHDLQLAGLVSSAQRCELTEEGRYRGLAALRQLPAALFGAFGMAKWFRHERSKAVMRRHRAAAAWAKAERQTRQEAQGSLFLNGMKQRFRRGRSSSTTRPPADGRHGAEHVADHADENLRRRAGLIKMQHPDWDREACYAQAYRELGYPSDTPHGSPPLR